MFCYQCEQTYRTTACTDTGVCGKDEPTAALQDLLLHAAKGVSQYAHRARPLGAKDAEIDHFVLEALFTTVTNVNFDPLRIERFLKRAADLRDRACVLYEKAARQAGKSPESVRGPATWTPARALDGLVQQGEAVSILGRKDHLGPETRAAR